MPDGEDRRPLIGSDFFEGIPEEPPARPATPPPDEDPPDPEKFDSVSTEKAADSSESLDSPTKHKISMIVQEDMIRQKELKAVGEENNNGPEAKGDLTVANDRRRLTTENGRISFEAALAEAMKEGVSDLKEEVLRLALPHVTLLLVSITYAAIGGWILTLIRLDDESSSIDHQQQLAIVKRNLTGFLCSFGRGNASREKLNEALGHFSQQVQIAHRESRQAANFLTPGSSAVSNLPWNLFFAATSLTSIGYGADAPDSHFGRIFCLAYLFFGIPLYLITLADLAKFLTALMNRCYTRLVKIQFRWRRKYRRWKSGKRRDSFHNFHLIIAGGDDEVAEFLWTHLENAHFVEVPFYLVIGILLLYIMFSSWLIAWIQDWALADGVYFVMMSVLTIGFGDLVPRNDMYIIIVLILVLAGLVLTTTCVDIVGAYYIERLHFFGRRLEEDPMRWLKEVQRRRIELMKREAMRKLLETVTVLNNLRFTTMKHIATYQPDSKLIPTPPDPPRELIASHATADSMLLRWKPPEFLEEGRKYWYRLTYKTRNPQRKCPIMVVEYINKEKYLVTGLKSFALYEFSICTCTRFGASTSCRAQEYTEPCSVPTSLRLDAISFDTATLSWKQPKVNNATESYVVQYAQEPAPQFPYWFRFKVGNRRKFTITDLLPDTTYIICVSAEHNVGLAAMSKSIHFRTKVWWGDEDSTYLRRQYFTVCMSSVVGKKDPSYLDMLSLVIDGTTLPLVQVEIEHRESAQSANFLKDE